MSLSLDCSTFNIHLNYWGKYCHLTPFEQHLNSPPSVCCPSVSLLDRLLGSRRCLPHRWPLPAKTRGCLCIAQGKSLGSHCSRPSPLSYLVWGICQKDSSEKLMDRWQTIDLLVVENTLFVSCFIRRILTQIEIKFSILKCFIDFKMLFL